MNNSDKTALTCFGAIGVVALVPLLMILGYLINGFVLSKMWLWFVVTTFGAPVLTIPQAIGVAMVVGFLTQHNAPKKNEKKEWKEVASDILASLLAPFITLLIAWIVYSGWIIQ